MDILQLILKNTRDIKSLKRQLCCSEAGCPDLSADIGNIIECRTDGLFAEGGGGSIEGANMGLSINGTDVQFGQSVGAVGDPAILSEDREIPLSDFTINFLGVDTHTGVQNGNMWHERVDNGTGFFFEILSDTPTFYIYSDTDKPAIAMNDGSGNSCNIGIVGGSTYGYMQANGIRLLGGAKGVNMDLLHIGPNVIVPTAYLHIDAGTAAINTAPIKLTTGTNNTTAETGAIEYNGTNLFFTRTGTTRENIFVGVSGATAPANSLQVNSGFYYGNPTIAVLGTPNSWASVVISGTTYKIPLYT